MKTRVAEAIWWIVLSAVAIVAVFGFASLVDQLFWRYF